MISRAALLHPVAAYDQIAPHYVQLVARRRLYLDAVDRLIVKEIPKHAQSLLDVGSGDGKRALRIARKANLKDIVLDEPSEGMRKLWPAGVTGWDTPAEDLALQSGTFDVITCLWNVIGHVGAGHERSSRVRAEVLSQFMRLLGSNGVAFVDVNHRYNVNQYGWMRTAARFSLDVITPRSSRGDVIAEWELAGSRTATSGHVFTDREFRRLCRDAGAVVEKSFIVDYGTGASRRFAWMGNLLYKLRRG